MPKLQREIYLGKYTVRHCLSVNTDKLTFPAHACHKTALVATILTADASLLRNVTVPITLTSKGGLAIFCASDIKALKEK